MARQPLGRGLSALLGEHGDQLDPAPGSEIDISEIDANPQQPRKAFDEGPLEELAQSIRTNGVVQPIVLRKAGSRYQIVAGERRWRAAQRAGLRRIPAVVQDVSDEKMLELALVENIQRQELNPIEEAKAYRELIDRLQLTQETVAERVGKERSVITTSLRLLRLPGEIQRWIEQGKLSAGHGRALLTAESPLTQTEAANLAIANKWSVRETERAVKRIAAARADGDTEKSERKVDPNVKAAETRLMRTLSTNVKIHEAKKGAGGKIEIEYYSMDDLNRLFDLLMKN